MTITFVGAMAERLRRSPAKRICKACAGSNPAGTDKCNFRLKYRICVSNIKQCVINPVYTFRIFSKY